MEWSEDGLNGAAVYTQAVEEGFISTEGYCDFGFGDKEKHDLGGKIALPLINFLKVNPEHPIEVKELGPLRVLPVGDKRWPGESHSDSKVYNSVGFLMVPYNISEKDLGAWKKLSVFENGFENLDGSKSPLSVLYVEKGLAADGQGIYTWSAITPPQVVRGLFNWLRSKKEFSYLEENWPKMEEHWHNVGRVTISPKEIRLFVSEIGLRLEERFGERLFCERPKQKS